MDPRSRALLGQVQAALGADPDLVLPVLDAALEAALGGQLLDPGTRARIKEGILVRRGERQQERRRLSDAEMAAERGVNVKTFRRGIEADPEVLACSSSTPTPGGKWIRKWRPWEVEARWPNGVPTRKRRGT